MRRTVGLYCDDDIELGRVQRKDWLALEVSQLLCLRASLRACFGYCTHNILKVELSIITVLRLCMASKKLLKTSISNITFLLKNSHCSNLGTFNTENY